MVCGGVGMGSGLGCKGGGGKHADCFWNSNFNSALVMTKSFDRTARVRSSLSSGGHVRQARQTAQAKQPLEGTSSLQ